MESTHQPGCRYRLYVAASNVIDLIGGAGGWLADHAMAGWDVSAYIAHWHDDRDSDLLQILGVSKFQTARSFWEPNAPYTFAVAPDLYERDVRVRAYLSRAIKCGEHEVFSLGEHYPLEMPGTPTSVEHQCSLAAQAFKTQALTAAGASAYIAPREFLFGWPATRLSATDYATRISGEGAVGRPLTAVSLAP